MADPDDRGGPGCLKEATIAKKTFRPRFGVVIVLPLLIMAWAVAGKNFIGRVAGVHDGDTISLMKNSLAVKVRLEGMDAPELGQARGTRAKQYTSRLVFAMDVEVREFYPDWYGRMVARVLVGGQDVSLELVRAGLAWHFKKYSSDPDAGRGRGGGQGAEEGTSSLKNDPPKILVSWQNFKEEVVRMEKSNPL